MFDIGQPSHAYDTDKVLLPLGVRRANAGEHLALLDQTEHDLTPVNVVITGDNLAVAAAGVMGGASSTVSDATTAVTLEVANFDALATRRSAAKLNIRSNASSRFEKALDTQRVDLCVRRFIALLKHCLPEARIEGYDDLRENLSTQAATITVGTEFLLSRLGK
jgi:phenylalanyl-tRNA synthetase beta chain